MLLLTFNVSFFSISHFCSPFSVIHILISFLLDQKTINEKLFFSLSDSRLTQQNMSTQNRSQNINLLVSCRDALPLSCMRLVGAKVTKLRSSNILLWRELRYVLIRKIETWWYLFWGGVFFFPVACVTDLKKTSSPCIHQA